MSHHKQHISNKLAKLGDAIANISPIRYGAV